MTGESQRQARDMAALMAEVIGCRICPRLVEWRERVAVERRAAYRDDDYWGRPVPGFGDPLARLVVVGLAPAAHGANRTGRMFTGDRSGDWLFRAMHRAGFASRARSTGRDDGLTLEDAWVTAPVKCAPPANKPTVTERDACSSWFTAELDLLDRVEVFLCLGSYGYVSLWRYLVASGAPVPRPRPRFGHGLEVQLEDGRAVFASFHPSQQNTFTSRLTKTMLDEVFTRIRLRLHR